MFRGYALSSWQRLIPFCGIRGLSSSRQPLQTSRSTRPPAKLNLFGLPRPEFDSSLNAELGKYGWRGQHSESLWGWMYRYGGTIYRRIPGIRRELRDELLKKYTVEQALLLTKSFSTDGTLKFLLKFDSGQEVESVFIPQPNRGTLCVSSQVGCTLSCSFCHTGTQPVMRNLTAGEILLQVEHAKRLLDDFPKMEDRVDKKTDIADIADIADLDMEEKRQNEHEGKQRDEGKRAITNIVFMGQGEPFFNYKNVRQAIQIMSHPGGYSIGQSKITISTSGVVPHIYRLAEETNVNLAVSLHATTDELRNELVPLNKQYPLSQLIEACRAFTSKKKKRLMFEYVMLKGVNDTEKEAQSLVHLLSGFSNIIVNLIPFNSWPGAPYECSSDEQIIAFHQILTNHHLPAYIRWARGRDIMAACGQLKTHYDRVNTGSVSDVSSQGRPPFIVT